MNAAEKWEALVEDIADRVAAKLRVDATPSEYTQDSPPAGMSRRTYQDHCYANHWPTQKRGRLRVTLAADYQAWRDKHPVKRAVDALVEEIGDEIKYLEHGGRPPAKSKR